VLILIQQKAAQSITDKLLYILGYSLSVR